MEEEKREENQQVIKVLELLKQASHDLRLNPSSKLAESNSAAIKALLELETESDTILSDPNLSQLSQHLSYLKTLVETLPKTQFCSLRTFLLRLISTHQISRVAESIESDLQAWIDRELVESLVKAIYGLLLEVPELVEETELSQLLNHFCDRVSQGFNPELQDLVLKSRLFFGLEMILTNPTHSIKLREKAAFAIESLIGFNKNVFVGQVLMGPTTRTLISMGSSSSLKVLCSLIRSIKSSLVNEIDYNNQIATIIKYMSSEEHETQVIGFECVLEIGYFGRKEAVEAMMNANVVEKLMELQRSEMGGNLIDEARRMSTGKYLEQYPFASSVARFAMQLEVGEGMRKREKRSFKQEILKRVQDASLSDAEAATIQIEVLWGSFS